MIKLPAQVITILARAAISILKSFFFKGKSKS